MQKNEQPLPSLVVLTGFRATGKTVVGKKLAVLLNTDFLDTDAEIEDRMGMTIAESVARFGWSRFRSEEKRLLEELAGRKERAVIATGGGAVCHRDVWRQLRKNGRVVWLQADSATIRSRLQADRNTATQRPPLQDSDRGEEIEALLAEREPLYRRGADMVVVTEGKTPEQLAAGIRDRLGGKDRYAVHGRGYEVEGGC